MNRHLHDFSDHTIKLSDDEVADILVSFSRNLDLPTSNIKRTYFAIRVHNYLKNSHIDYNSYPFEFAIKSFNYYQSLQPDGEKKETPDFLSVLWYILDDYYLKLPKNITSIIEYDRKTIIKDLKAIEIEKSIIGVLKK